MTEEKTLMTRISIITYGLRIVGQQMTWRELNGSYRVQEGLSMLPTYYKPKDPKGMAAKLNQQ